MQTRTVIRYTLLVIFLLPVIVFGQDRCGTAEHLKNASNSQTRELLFEQWLNKKLKARRSNTSTLRTKATRKIPVVVHIIHKGEPIGTGTNISDAQVISQITVLNKDYQRLNADANETPDMFEPLAGEMDIEFELARRTPEGLPTSGIVRVQGPNRNWTSADDAEFKALSYWNADNYMNIWVVDIIDYLGYSQFPISDLPGLEGSPDAPYTDGIVINPSVFGSDDFGDFDLDPDYNKGRTTTHEVGHFFGLRHIWGDDGGSCMTNGGNSDYVDDTPDQENNSVGCPNHPKTGCNNTVAMIQNYMDYTDDVCMNLFTIGQIERMNTILESSPRRLSLLSSNGLDDPDPVTTENLTMKGISAPVVTCSDVVDLAIRIKNNGVDINSYKIKIIHNGVTTTESVTGITFPTGEEIDYVVNAFQLNAGQNNLTIEIIEPNGADDTFPADNSLAFRTVVNTDMDFVPLKEDFENETSAWTITNPLLGMDWTKTKTNFGTSIYFDGFSNNTHNDRAWLVSPVLDLTHLTEGSIQFDVSYGYRPGTADNLKVLGSTDCGQTFDYIIYNATGEDITAGAVNFKWNPSDEGDWETKHEPLDNLLGQPNVRIAFVFTNANGNNLYLDNIELFTTNDPVKANGKTALQVFPNGVRGPAPALRLNLPERDNIQIEVINSMGQRIKTMALNDALNQTIDLGMQIDADSADPNDETVYTTRQGVYFVRVTGAKGSYVERFVVLH